MAGPAAPVADATPDEAFAAAAGDPATRIVDVRTRAEWMLVGVPETPTELVTIEWQSWPGMQPVPDFADTLARAVPDKAAPLYFLCRSGARSMAAARLAASLGYERCFNVTDGFEGPPDADGHRGNLAGWKASGLPWRQT